MGISNFYTVNIKAAGAPTGVAAQTALGGPLNGMNFIDFILAQLAQKAEGTEGEHAPDAGGENSLLQSGNPLLAKDPKLDIATLIAANPEIAEEISALSTDEQTKLMETLALNQKAFDDILKPLIADGEFSADDMNVLANLETKTGAHFKLLDSVLIDSETSGEISLDRLKAIMAKIEALAAENGSPAFVTTNLTPGQIAELQDILSGKSDKTLDDAAFAGVFIGLIQIVPPTNKGNASLPQSVAQGAAAKTADALASELNSIVPGGEGDLSAEEDAQAQFGKILKDITGKKAGSDKTLAQNPKSTPDGSLLQNWPFPQMGSLLTTPDWVTDLMDKMGFQAQSASTITGLGAAINTATHAGSAALPHPGTQMVAATLQKAAADGEAKNLILQLDPPELGRIEIQMSFGKDKAVKAVMIAEKPETMAMLQRDAHVLERALTSTGFEADGALSFQLAQEGYDFNHNGRHDGHGGHGGGKDSADGETQLIETTMTWFVDPETGHMRYNFVA